MFEMKIKSKTFFIVKLPYSKLRVFKTYEDTRLGKYLEKNSAQIYGGCT